VEAFEPALTRTPAAHRSAIGRGMFPRLIEGRLVEYEAQQTGQGRSRCR